MLLNKLKTRYYALTMVMLFTLISGCAGMASDSGPSDAALSGDSNAMWVDGQKMAERGEEFTAKGEDRLKDGRRQVRDGEAMIREGHRRVENAY